MLDVEKSGESVSGNASLHYKKYLCVARVEKSTESVNGLKLGIVRAYCKSLLGEVIDAGGVWGVLEGSYLRLPAI